MRSRKTDRVDSWKIFRNYAGSARIPDSEQKMGEYVRSWKAVFTQAGITLPNAIFRIHIMIIK